MPHRLYTEKEISAILKRSGELQAERGPTDLVGLSLEEVQQIAAEAGLDPSVVALAAAQLEQGDDASDLGTWLGLPVRLDVERVLAGEVDAERWPALAEAMGRAFGVVGASGQVGRMLQWTYTSRHTELQVTLTPGDGQTRVQVFGNFKRAAARVLLPITLFMLFQGFIMPMGALGVPLLGSTALALSLAALTYLLIRIAFGRYVARKEGAAHRLMGSLETLLTPTSAPATASTATTAPALSDTPALPLPDAEGDPAAAPHPRTRHRT